MIVPEEWLTWQQAGERFGLSPDAVRMRARRLGWRTQPNNEGRTLVLVPADAEVRPRERAPEHMGAHSAVRSGEQSVEIMRLATLLEASDGRAKRAETRVEQAEQRADRAEKRADAADTDRRSAEARADRAEQAVAGERSRADTLRDRLDAAEDELRQAREAADQARQHATDAEDAIEAARRADAERKARGRWTRLRTAWRGE
jgi:chromosome segregation ATPase